MDSMEETYRYRIRGPLINVYKALYYGYFGCVSALRWRKYLPGKYHGQVVLAKIRQMPCLSRDPQKREHYGQIAAS